MSLSYDSKTKNVFFSKFNSKSSIGILVILTSSCLYALTHVISKPLVESNSHAEINPLVLVFIIYIINGVFFTPFARRKSSSTSKIGKKNLILIAGIGVAELTGMIFYFFGLKDSSAVNASIFDNAEIIFALMIAIIIFRDRLKKNELVPFFMIVSGVMVLPVMYDIYQYGALDSNLFYGNILIIFSGLFLAIDVNLYRFVSEKISSHRIMQIYSFSGGLFALGMIFALGVPIEIELGQMLPVTLVSLLGVGLPTIFFLISLRLIGSVKTIIIYSTTSIFGIVFAALILGESFSYVHAISTAIVIAGIFMLRKKLSDNDS